MVFKFISSRHLGERKIFQENNAKLSEAEGGKKRVETRIQIHVDGDI